MLAHAAVAAVYDEMKQGPLAKEEDHGVREIREALRRKCFAYDAMYLLANCPSWTQSQHQGLMLFSSPSSMLERRLSG